MKQGVCLKCNAKTVYRHKDGLGSSDCHYINMGSVNVSTSFDTFLCTNCGYFENYVVNTLHLADITKGKGEWVHCKS